MKKVALKITTLLAFLIALQANGQKNLDQQMSSTRINVLFGLNQPLLSGFNMEGNIFYKRFAFDYSHGVSLNLDNEFLDPINKELALDVHIPWTTGFGIGYRFNQWFNLRAEPKWHKFELYDQGTEQVSENLIVSYTTFSMGIGAYANFRPFKRKKNFLNGIMIVPSLRWWPRVSSSLNNNQVDFYSPNLDSVVTHEALEVGINNTPLIVNISIGYSFGLPKK